MRSCVLPAEARADLLLERYEQLRKRIALPRFEQRRGAPDIHVDFEPFPPALDRSDLVLVARAIAWLSALEREWGEPLGGSLHEGELCFDAERNLFVVGPGLLCPSGADTELVGLGSALGVDSAGLSSFGELAARASSVHSDLEGVFASQGSPEDTIRHLCALAERSSSEEALRYTQLAFRVRPTDPSLACRLARAWLDSKRPGEPPDVRAVLEGSALVRPGSAVLLSRLARARSELPEARRFIEIAVQAAPQSAEAWRELARVAHLQGDRERTLSALSALARLGDTSALGKLVEQQKDALVSEILEHWSGEWTGEIVRLRLADLHRGERLKDLLLTFLEHIDRADPSMFSAIREAAERLGTLSLLREDLWRAVESSPHKPEILSLLIDVCQRTRATAQILSLSARYPNTLPAAVVADALWEERKYEELLVYAPGEREIAPLRLRAMIQLELSQTGRFSPQQWESAAHICQLADGGSRVLSAQVAALQRHAPRFGPLPLLALLVSA